MGIGKNILDPLSAAIVDKVCRYLSCRAVGEAAITPAASLRAREALSSPCAAMVCNVIQNVIHSLLFKLWYNYVGIHNETYSYC